MTQDDVIRLAKEAGWSLDSYHGVLLARHIPQDGIEAFAKLVAEHEREACAKVCETRLGPTATDFYGKTYATAIRARGNA